MKTKDREPELIIPLQDQQHRVTFSNALRSKEISGFRGIIADVLKGKDSLFALLIGPDHRPAIRPELSHFVHNVVCKVEILGGSHPKMIEETVFVKPFLTELFIKILNFHELFLLLLTLFVDSFDRQDSFPK